MATLHYDYELQIDDPNNAFGQVVAPEVAVGGGMGMQARMNGKSMQGLRFDSDLACLTLVPRDVPSDMVAAAHILTGGTWKEVVSPTTGKKALCQLACPALDIIDPPSSDCGLKPDFSPSTPLVGQGQGIWLDIGRSRPVPGAAASSENAYVRVVFYKDGVSLWYRLNWGFFENPRIERSEDNGATWDRMGDIPVSDGGAVSSGDAAMLKLQIMRANGYIVFRSTEGGCVVPDFEPAKAFIMSVRNCNVSVSWRPVLFNESGTFVSPPFMKTFANTKTPVPIVQGDESDGVTITPVSTGSDWTAKYSMEVEAQDGGLTTPFVWSAGLRFPADTMEPGEEDWQTVGSITGYELSAQFAPRGLTIERYGRVFGNNRYAQFGAADGMRACRILMNVGVRQPDGSINWLGPAVRFCGWLNLDSISTETEWSAALTDRADYELGVPLLDDLILDGDCVYHAVKMLCQRAGFTRGYFKDDLPGNPEDAWDCDGITCNPELGHTRLGRGFDQNPLWSMAAGMPIRQHIARIQLEQGLWYFGIGTDGRVWFHPWDFTGVRAAWTPKQIFSYQPQFTSGVPNLNEFTGAIVRRVDRSTVRNSVTVVGLDKETWEPLVAHEFDAASVYGAPASPRFMGRVRPFFESDSRYAIASIADSVAERQFALFRDPIDSYDPLEVIPQPLNPLDYIGVAATFAMPVDEKFYIGSVRETMRVVESELGATRIDGTMLLSAIVVPNV